MSRSPSAPDRPLRVFLIAGESSGDVLGGRLISALRARAHGGVEVAGIGGPCMAAEGLESLFPYSELAVMGLAEVIPRARSLFRRMKETAREIDRFRPDILVTIDAPAFVFGVVRRLKSRDAARVHYVAPQVWAWRPWRVRKFRRRFDHLMALFPFEPPYFTRAGLGCTFVGHPVVECGADRGDGGAFRERYEIAEDAPVLCLLPGSRRGEVSRLLEPFGETAHRMARRLEGLRVVVPTVAHAADIIRARTADWSVPVVVVEGHEEGYGAMAASNVALAASGTVSLELAMAGVPCVTAHRVWPPTAWILRRMIRIPYVNSVNLLAGHEAIPELLQEKCRPDKLEAELMALLLTPERRRNILEAQNSALRQLGLGGRPPSERAADVVFRFATEHCAADSALNETRVGLSTLREPAAGRGRPAP